MAAQNVGDGVLEGFLCPICMKDYVSPSQLLSHFEDFHGEDKDILKQLRIAFGKAKNKILKKEEPAIPVSSDNAQAKIVSKGTPGSGGIDLALWQPQTLGITRRHFPEFKKDRRERIERYVVETNKILIRLEKLIKAGIYKSDSSMPGALKARKDLEKRIVPWESDSDVKFCRNCMKKFNVLTRRHHCRLCGKVYCGDCLDTISSVEADDILSPHQEPSSFGKDQRDNGSDDKNGIRTCYPCLELLDRHCQRKTDGQGISGIVDLYERMKRVMAECDVVLPNFIEMAESINSGYTSHSLDAANEAKVKLFKLFETVDVISKKIQFLGTSGEAQPQPQALRLQRSIRNHAAGYLQENMFTAPSLPTRDKYEELVRIREKDLERQRQEEKQKRQVSLLADGKLSPSVKNLNLKELAGKQQGTQASRMVTLKPDEESVSAEDDAGLFGSLFGRGSLRSKFNKKTPKQFTAVSIAKSSNAGWGPVNVTMSGSPDPMLQQMDIIKGYIRQAKQERRFEEVELFEQNLKELELEYMKQRHGK